MNLVHVLEGHAGKRPEHPALLEGEQAVSYAELNARVCRLAGALEAQGIRSGSRVLVFVPMSIDLYIILLAVLHVGATVVFVDPGMGRRQIEAAVALATPDAWIGVPRAHWLRWVSPALRAIPLRWKLRRHQLDRMSAGFLDARAVTDVDDSEPALLTFTSGSTGQPKGVLRTHGLLWSQHKALRAALQTGPGDVELQALPIFVLNTLAVGATAVIPRLGRRVADVAAAPLAEAIQAHGVTTVAGSPALYRPLIAYCQAQGLRFPGVRAMFLGGAPVPPDLLAKLAPLLPNGDSWVVYGSTEAEPISHMSASEVLSETAAATARGDGLCVGKPVDAVRVRLEDDEILVSGDHVNPSYYRNEAAVARYKVCGSDGTIWHRTGDLGRFDERGRLWLLGRRERAVNHRGQRIYPFSVELAARALAGVEQAALLTHKDQLLLVVSGERENMSELVALHPAIDRVQAVTHIPTDRRHNAKVDYEALAKRL